MNEIRETVFAAIIIITFLVFGISMLKMLRKNKNLPDFEDYPNKGLCDKEKTAYYTNKDE